MNPNYFFLAAILGVAVSSLSPPAFAKAGHGYAFGAPGKPEQASRNIEVNLADNYYEPDAITVKKNETVRFVLQNSGEFLHEFSIDTLAAHVAHRQEMAEMMEMGMLTPTGVNKKKMNMTHSNMDMGEMDHSEMGMSDAEKGNGTPMQHDDPNTVLLAPGESKELVWKFTRAMKIEFACNMPGHYESGMKGAIRFVQ